MSQNMMIHFDTIIVGSGISGLQLALKLTDLNPKLKIALLSKGHSGQSNSVMAQAGVAAPLPEDHSIISHIEDTVKSGSGINQKHVVEKIISEAPRVIKDLADNFVNFREECNKGAGHSLARLYNLGDQTGLGIVKALLNKLKTLSNVHFFENHLALDLIVNSDNQEVVGVKVLSKKAAEIYSLLSHATVLATGGFGELFSRTTNVSGSLGDGIALAHRAGCNLQNLEFCQFHPTALAVPKYPDFRFLISGAVRGKGAYLINPKTQERFMTKYDPERMELTTRDTLSQSILTEMQEHHLDSVHLDIRHQSEDFLKEAFPKIFKALRGIGLNMSQDFIPVAPAFHYACGGIATDVYGQTNLSRLYAIGEVADSGMHGANRLIGNALLECLVAGDLAAQKIIESLKHSSFSDPFNVFSFPREGGDSEHLKELKKKIQFTMMNHVGIIRTEEGLNQALKIFESCRNALHASLPQSSHSCEGGNPQRRMQFVSTMELENMITVAELITKAALVRKESCGTHFLKNT